MREIKFRAWSEDDGMISPDYISRDGRGHWKSNSIPNASDKLMQYTGLKDKNGKEIYEGDIYRTPMTKFDVVEWNRAGFNPLENEEYIEVIGNIYEIPELAALPTDVKVKENE